VSNDLTEFYFAHATILQTFIFQQQLAHLTLKGIYIVNNDLRRNRICHVGSLRRIVRTGIPVTYKGILHSQTVG